MSLIDKLMAPVNTTVISILGIGQMLMGLWVTLPWASLPAFNLTFPPEWFIGILLASIGLMTTIFSLKGNLKKLQWATQAGYLFWIIGSIFMVTTYFTGVGWIAGLIFATYCFMINLNIRVNRRSMKKKNK
jgi:hypothetical protein